MDSPGTENLPQPQILVEKNEESVFTRIRQVSYLERLEALLARFSPAERLLLYVFSILLGLSVVVILIGLNAAISVEVPARGGSFVEGETGPARFINPVLAISDADQDLSQF